MACSDTKRLRRPGFLEEQWRTESDRQIGGLDRHMSLTACRRGFRSDGS